ncbi:MAG: hypothetical protein LBP20_08970 [Treponema sp.]|jgi:hypothetical protein|nr:hypothetical protein [Treponema sp.]
MKKFWRAPGISLLPAVIVGIIMGFVSGSSGMISPVMSGAVSVGFGLCGITGLVVVSVEMFFEDRAKSRGGGKCG